MVYFMSSKIFFLYFLMIFLIASLTPAGAVLISQANGSNATPQPTSEKVLDDEKTLNSIEMQGNKIEEYVNSINNDVEHIKTLANDYNWQIWKWPKITDNIIETLHNIESTSEKIKEPTNELNKLANKLKESELTDDVSYIANGDDSYDEDDAQGMADELSKRLSTDVNCEMVAASEIKKGDIVQYMSQGKYPRYLEVVDISYPTANNKNPNQSKITSASFLVLNNSNDKTLLSTLRTNKTFTAKIASSALNGNIDLTSASTPFLVLKGTGSLAPKSYLKNYIRLNSPVNIRKEDILQNSVDVQEDNIEDSTDKAHDLQKSAENCYKHAKNCGIATGVFGGLSCLPIIFLGLTALSIMFAPPLTPIFAMATVITGLLDVIFVPITVLLGITAGILYGVGKYKESQAKAIENSAKLDQKDLDQYTEIGPNGMTRMNVTTFDGVPIVKHPSMDDWKKYQTIVLKNPDHGTLLMGPGLQFLYGPDEGYTGEDQFVFQYIKDSKIMGIIIVNATVQPIPLFTLQPGEEV